MSTAAFVIGAVAVPTAASSAAVSSFTIRSSKFAAPTVRSAKISPPTMLNSGEQDFDPKNHTIPEGFTPFAEKLNGRMAMMGFFLAIATEIINPNHPGIIQQVSVVKDAITYIIS
jgi:hypothetical protein